MTSSTLSLLESLGQVIVEVAVRVGQAHVPLAAVAAFGAGSVVRLDCTPDAPVTLLVNGVAVARGELVLTDDDQLAIEIRDVS